MDSNMNTNQFTILQPSQLNNISSSFTNIHTTNPTPTPTTTTTTPTSTPTPTPTPTLPNISSPIHQHQLHQAPKPNETESSLTSTNEIDFVNTTSAKTKNAAGSSSRSRDRHALVNGRERRISIPSRVASQVSQLTKTLGLRNHGKTIEWLLHHAEPSIVAKTGTGTIPAQMISSSSRNISFSSPSLASPLTISTSTAPTNNGQLLFHHPRTSSTSVQPLLVSTNGQPMAHPHDAMQGVSSPGALPTIFKDTTTLHVAPPLVPPQSFYVPRPPSPTMTELSDEHPMGGAFSAQWY